MYGDFEINPVIFRLVVEITLKHLVQLKNKALVTK